MSIDRRQFFQTLSAGMAAALVPQSLSWANTSNAPIFLDSNENPYGPSQAALAAAEKAARNGAYYAWHLQTELKSRIAAQFDLSQEHIALATGSNEALCAACSAWGWPGPIVAPALTYTAHLNYGENLGMTVKDVKLDDEMHIDLDAMASAVTPNTQMIYLCNPNNPTGLKLNADELRAFCRTLSRDAIVLVDEAYVELTDSPDVESMVDLVRAGEQVVLTRTYSKLHGLAGLRVGYALARPDLIKTLKQHVMSWQNSVGVAAASASTIDHAFIAASREKIFAGRKIVSDALRQAGGKVLPSHTNFVYAQFDHDIQSIVDDLKHRNVNLRPAYAGHPNWLRVSMGKLEDLQVFARELAAIS